MIFSMDYRYYQSIALDVRFRAFRGHKVWADTKGFRYGTDVEKILTKGSEGISWSLGAGINTGANSGFAALNFALLLGADPIYLMGFDFQEDSKGTHFHSGYCYSRPDGKLNSFRGYLERAAPDIIEHGRKVVNLSPRSMLKCFPFEAFENVPRNPDFRVVSFYTDANYKILADRLQASLDLFKIPHDIRAVPSRGSWDANTAYKPEFLRDMMDAHPGENIVWIDADGIVQRYPILFHEIGDHDFGLYYMPRRDGRIELLSGTMFLAGNERVRGMMDEWIREARAATYFKDQRSLQAIVARNPGRFKIAPIPPSYCQIFDTMRHFGSPVIEHFQASRKLKRDVK